MEEHHHEVDLELGKLQEVTEENRFRRETLFKSCCFFVDQRCIKFGSQVCFSLILMGFSIYKLCVTDDDAHNAPYYVLLSSTVSAWMPNPKLPIDKISPSKTGD